MAHTEAEGRMPRYFITTADGFRADDEEGIELDDIPALRAMLRQTLVEILSDEGRRAACDEVTAEAHDEAGRWVMHAKVSFSAVEG